MAIKQCVFSFVAAMAMSAALAIGQTTRPAKAPKAKNVIVFVSDGGGFNAYVSTSYYQYGRLGAQPYEQSGWAKCAGRTFALKEFPEKKDDKESEKKDEVNKKDEKKNGKVAIYDPAEIWNIQTDADFASALARGEAFKGYKFVKDKYTDSAAAGTAMASGSKTVNTRVNVIQESFDEAWVAQGLTLAEVAKSLGKTAGVVTSVEWNDATPATFGGAHDVGRGDRKGIANEMLTSGTLDIIMGCGNPEYDRDGAPRRVTRDSDYDIAGGRFTWDLLKTGRHSRGWKVVQTRAEFEALTRGPTPQRVFGLPLVASTLQQKRSVSRDWDKDGAVDAADARYAPAFGDPQLTSVPTLATMTRAALNVASKNPKGFFLMIEGGAVDWAAHANQPGRLIEEMIDFNKSIAAAVEWVEANGGWKNTLIIITSDHDTGLLWGPDSDMIAYQPITNRGAGKMPGMTFNYTSHTNMLVPLRARGPGVKFLPAMAIGADPVFGDFVENTAVYDLARSAMTGEAPRLPQAPDPKSIKVNTTRPSKWDGGKSYFE